MTHNCYYWLAVPSGTASPGSHVDASYEGQTITISKGLGVSKLFIRLDDRMMDLDQPIRIVYKNLLIYENIAPRTFKTLL